MGEKEPNLRFLVLRAVIAVAVVLIVLLVLRFTGAVRVEHDVPVPAVQSAEGI